MSRRIEAVKRGARRRKRMVAAGIAAIAALGVFAIAAIAVHDEDFQLDGNTRASETPSATEPFDWDSFFNAAGGEKTPLPANFDASGFDRDFATNANGTFNTSDPSTFSTGSKDTLPITPGWQCGFSSNVNSKTDVTNAYAASYTSPTNGHEILYFGLERNANTGTGNIGFWFLQDDVSCETTTGNEPFVGDHADGDILVVSEFSNGGAVATIQAYKWEGGANGSLNPQAVAEGASCGNALGSDSVCARVNTGTITTDWLTANKQDGAGHTLRVSEFFEAGLDLTEEGLGGKCFNTFMGVTRSSTSLTATIFDFSLGQLGQCASTTVTTPSVPATGTIIEADGTNAVTDNANITVTGADDWSGTLKFFICGPIATGTCDKSDAAHTGGQLGSTQTITDATTMPVTSATATITEAGRYCFRAEFGGDASAGVPPSEDSTSGECFTIGPRQPTLDTQAGAGPVDFGNAVTDTATLANTANQPGTGGIGVNGSINPTTPGGPADGTITFTLKKANCTDNATGTGTNPQTRTVSGDATYGPVSFTPDAPGDYHWIASYDGDSPNTLSATHNTACNDSDEDVTVRTIPTEIATSQSVIPNDSATITSSVAGDNLPAGGDVVFSLYGPTAGATALENCQAGGATGRLYTETDDNVGGAHSDTAETHNTTVSVSASTTYYWLVTYAPGDTAHTGRQSDCAENTVLTFNNDAGPGTLFP